MLLVYHILIEFRSMLEHSSEFVKFPECSRAQWNSNASTWQYCEFVSILELWNSMFWNAVQFFTEKYDAELCRYISLCFAVSRFPQLSWSCPWDPARSLDDEWESLSKDFAKEMTKIRALWEKEKELNKLEDQLEGAANCRATHALLTCWIRFSFILKTFWYFVNPRYFLYFECGFPTIWRHFDISTGMTKS